MVIERSIIAKKYALAFFIHYDNQVDQTTISRLEILLNYIKKRSDVLAFLALSTVPEIEKNNIRKAAINALELGYGFRQLMKILYRHKRIYLLEDVLRQIIYTYNQKNNIHIFNVWTSHPINENEKFIINNFIQKNVNGNKIFINYSIDKKLISGIRIKSNTLFWEQSIAKQLRDLERSLLEKVQI